VAGVDIGEVEGEVAGVDIGEVEGEAPINHFLEVTHPDPPSGALGS
jgi:hypothetical protein